MGVYVVLTIWFDFLVAVSAKDDFIGIVNKIPNCHLPVNFIWPLDHATQWLQRPYQVVKCGGGSLERAAGWLSASISAWVPGRDHPSGGNLGVFLVGMARPRSSHDGVFRANGEKHEGYSRTATIAASDST